MDGRILPGLRSEERDGGGETGKKIRFPFLYIGELGWGGGGGWIIKGGGEERGSRNRGLKKILI